MVSSFALHYRNERTLRELMRIHPDEHPVSIQLFGHDAEVMRSGAAIAAEAGADLIDINMGCPVPKVRRTGAGAQLLRDPELALALARGAAEGSGGVPVTVKLRSGIEAGDRSGFELAVRLAEEAGVAAIAFHPRAATKGHKGTARLRADPGAGRAGRGAGDRLRRPLQRRGGPPRLRGVRRRRGDDRPRLARQPLGVRGTDRAAAAEPPAPRGGRRRAALGDRPRRGAPRQRARGALPAQVLPLVHGAPGGSARRSSTSSSAAPISTARGS